MKKLIVTFTLLSALFAQASPKAKQAESGKEIYARTCVACHQANGQGIPNAFPPLAKSDYLNKDVNRAIDTVLNGLTGEVTVNGKKYNSVMTKQALSDDEIAKVLNYVYGSWGNNGSKVSARKVKRRRKKSVAK
jgi:nitrite reductase (NO-forming)